MDTIERVDILGSPVDVVTMPAAIKTVETMLAGRRTSVIVAMNPRKVMRVRTDPWMRNFLWQAALVLPDGIGVVKAARWFHGKRLERVTGIDMMLALCEYATRDHHPIFIFGAKEDVNADAVDVLRKKYPGIPIVGRHNGYVADSETAGLVAEINRSGAEILFVAQGSPRQEQFIAQYVNQLNVKICQGIGGSLDVISGRIHRAPACVQRAGLESLYRLSRDPRRYRNWKYTLSFLFLCLYKRWCRIPGRDSS
jgi:N-acetylglucosaminyldiphosphoundecaprenol N-acetyl-beta-D-mannosaminyltransferase